MAGDCAANGEWDRFHKFIDWCSKQKYQKIIIVAGNHDNYMQENIGANASFGISAEYCQPDIVYLCDSGIEFEYEVQVDHPHSTDTVNIDVLCYEKRKIKIWGSPWTKTFPGMNPHCKAFTVDTEEELCEKWANIPTDIDILVTHSPT